ncbi:right-handed parallel beta-helix repeat-containing protein [Phenylobacterium sp.]|uniref:right-handed parallel beta-helix repeat-containing protein n=1 Tax=Phenylobacterium sp. TaxID=1871053 RepID=UPI0025DA693A|nr:right-handed parallel beta-helix repeat-containing protein [Phenylobacterium sp.]
MRILVASSLLAAGLIGVVVITSPAIIPAPEARPAEEQAPTPAGPGSAGAPRLASAVTIPMGRFTQPERGGVRYGSAALGLLLSPGDAPVAAWRTSFSTCANPGHWIRAGFDAGGGVFSVQDGPTARTPTPSVSGANNLSGVCKFTVRAVNAHGVSNPATVTVTVDPNAASIGDNYQNHPGAIVGTIAAFEAGAKAGQRRLLLTPGINLGTSGLVLVNFPFTSEVKLVDADPARPSVLAGVVIAGSSGASSHITVESLTLDGPNQASEARLKIVNSNHIIARNLTIGRSEASYRRDFFGVLVDGTSSDYLLERNEVRYHQRGFYLGSGKRGVVRDNVVRYFLGQGIYLGPGVDGVLIARNVFLSPFRLPGDNGDIHFDFAQRADDFGGYLAREGGFDPPRRDTGVPQNDVWENNIFFNADGMGSVSGFASWRSGVASRSNNFVWRNNILATADANGFTLSSSGGASYILNNAIIKANVGDFRNAPRGASTFDIGPSLIVQPKNPGNWAGTMLIAGNFVGDSIKVESPFAAPTLERNVVYNRRRWPGSEYLNGDPRARLEGKSFQEYRAMSAAEIATWVKDSFRRFDDRGPVHKDGAWRTGAEVP